MLRPCAGPAHRRSLSNPQRGPTGTRKALRNTPILSLNLIRRVPVLLVCSVEPVRIAGVRYPLPYVNADFGSSEL